MGSGSDEVDEIRQQIDESRENLGHAVGALAYKADVKHRAKEVIDDKKEAVMEKVDELKSKVPGGDGEGAGLGDKVKDKLPSGADMSDKLDSVKAKLPDGVSDATSQLADKTPSTAEAKAKAHGIAQTAKEHPAAIAGGAAIAGLAAGLAIPETNLEREKLAPAAQDARAQVTERVQDTVAQVKSGVQDAAGSVADAVKEQGQQHGGKAGELAEKAADKTQEKVGPS
jgi:gas vesicle protein